MDTVWFDFVQILGDVSVSKLLGFETFPFFLMVSDSVSLFFGIEKSIGFGFVFFWYQKKYRIRFRNFLVSKKVSDSVSFLFGIEKVSDSVSKCLGIKKKYRIRFRKIT